MKIILLFSFMLCWVLLPINLFGQDCLSKLVLVLENIDGGVYSNQTVSLKNLADDTKYSVKSNYRGEAVFSVPCGQRFEINISNYTRKEEITSSQYNGGSWTSSFQYSKDMAEKEAFFAMGKTEQSKVDELMKTLPDTTFILNGRMRGPRSMEYYKTYTFILSDLKGNPLVGEEMVLTGEKRKKSFKGKTDAKGKLVVYLPKGDGYSINFKYNKSYDFQEVEYSRGIGSGELSLAYLGTAELDRRKKIEAERIRVEEERLAKERADFLAWCASLKLTEEEGHKRKLEDEILRRESAESIGSVYGRDTVVTAVLNRNNWSEKLIVCDLTGSMDPYAAQLYVWYTLNYKKEKNLQFVFFNDGDNKSDNQKVIGATGGIYYQYSDGMENLTTLMSQVRANGYGGDCPENNMEALIKGVGEAKPHKELVMIADNNAPVKDLTLLKDFDHPVHIILCGVTSGVLLDYLLIAWKTKGSIHTIEEDITKIAHMFEGEKITIDGANYRIMGGVFIRDMTY